MTSTPFRGVANMPDGVVLAACLRRWRVDDRRSSVHYPACVPIDEAGLWRLPRVPVITRAGKLEADLSANWMTEFTRYGGS
jgi:hypothetical protein